MPWKLYNVKIDVSDGIQTNLPTNSLFVDFENYSE